MAKDKHPEVRIHLDNLHDLFTQPIEDPFSKKTNFVSGIELIKSELPSIFFSNNGWLKTTIFLPKECIEPGLAEKTSRAIMRYCQFKARQNKRALASLRRQALTALLLGILFLFSGLLLSQFLERATAWPAILSTLFSDGFVIAFWVILWRPVDFFLFELWPYWREDRVYKHLMNMEINVAEEPVSERGF